jgi:hypothetical protein
MSNTETLQAVKHVKELTPGPVFNQGTDNQLYETEDGTYLASSWCPASEGYEHGETAVWESDDEGYPLDEGLALFGYGHAAIVPGDTPAHEEALAEFGYRVVSETTE